MPFLALPVDKTHAFPKSNETVKPAGCLRLKEEVISLLSEQIGLDGRHAHTWCLRHCMSCFLWWLYHLYPRYHRSTQCAFWSILLHWTGDQRRNQSISKPHCDGKMAITLISLWTKLKPWMVLKHHLGGSLLRLPWHWYFCFLKSVGSL